MASPGPIVNSSLQQIMDVSSRLGLFQPNNVPPVTPYSAATQFPTLNDTPTTQLQLNSGQQQQKKTIDMENTQAKQAKFNQAMSTGLGTLSFIDHIIPTDKPKSPVIRPLQSYNPTPYGTGSQAIAKDGIHIKPENRGKFTEWAQGHHMGVQEAARKIMAHKDQYSSTLVKRANFAKNFGGKKAANGLTLDDGPKKPYDWAGEMKTLSTHKLDGTSPLKLTKEAAQTAGINPALLYSSAYVEGMNQQLTDPRPMLSTAYDNALKGTIMDQSGKKTLGRQAPFKETDYPVDGFSAYGLDTFSDRYDEFVKKGYLPSDFKSQFTPYTATNELNQQVHTAAFKNNEAALTAKAAYLRSNQDDVLSYFKKKNTQLDPDAENFFTMAMYNASPKTAYKMMDEYIAAPDKKAYLDKGLTKYKNVYDHLAPRMQLMSTANQLLSSNMKNGGKLEDGGKPGDPNELDFKDSAGLKSGAYPKDMVLNLMKASKAVGVNPYDALAIAIQEGAFKKTSSPQSKGRRSRDLGNVSDNLFDDKDIQAMQPFLDKGLDYSSVRMAYALKKKMEYAKSLGYTDPAHQLQSYNGFGTITPETFGGSTKAYGVDISKGVNMKKNPLYGNRVLAIKSDLMKNKDFSSLQYKEGGIVPHLPEGTTHDLDPKTIKQLLDAGYELDFQ